MEVRISNININSTINFFYNMPLRGKQSRHRTKFIKLLTDRLKEVSEQEKQLLIEFAKKDEKGNPIKIGETRYEIEDIESLAKEKEILFNEEFVIDGGDNEDMLKTLKDVLENYNEELRGQEATLYDYLCEQFEKGVKE